nr:cysteine--tRNA ligase [Lachnospiraceae bacterium]
NSRLSELYDSSRINDDEDDEISDTLYERLNSFRQAFCDNMDDDFNTAGAIGTVFELVKFINQSADENTKGADLSAMRNTLLELTEVLGLDITENKGSLDDDIEALINERQEARKAKDFKRADEIRDDLKSRGIILEDTKDGVKWHREN